jgi:hypothetical protein
LSRNSNIGPDEITKTINTIQGKLPQLKHFKFVAGPEQVTNSIQLSPIILKLSESKSLESLSFDLSKYCGEFPLIND